MSNTLPLLRCSPPSLLLATNHLSLLPCSLKIFGIRCKVFLSNQLFLSNWVTLAWMSLPTPLPQSSLIFPTSKIFIHRLFQQPLSHDIILNLINKNTFDPRIFFLNFLFFNLFMAVLGLRFCVRAFSSCGKWGHSSSRCVGLSLSRPFLLRGTGSRCAGSVIVAHGRSCSAARGILPDQGSNPCPPHWQADSQPLRHQGSPCP